MAVPVPMPKMGISVESCILTTWHKKKGDEVKAGDVLFTYETDKSTVDEEAKVDGTLLEIFFEEGDDVPCMLNVAVIGNPGEDITPFKPDGNEEMQDTPVVSEQKEEKVVPVTAIAVTAPAEGFLKISPRARVLAEKSGVDARFAVPTGPEGRIIERDIRALIENGPVATLAAAGHADLEAMKGTGLGGRVSVNDLSAPAAADASVTEAPVSEYTDVKLPNIRKVIAKQMIHSLSSMAQLTNNLSFDASSIMAFRKQLKAHGEEMGLGNITLNDIVLYAVSRTLKDFKDLNAHMLDDDTIRYFTNVNLGVAVDTERGLMVPTIFNADQKSLNQISQEAKELAKACQGGSINPDLLKGGTFTVTNLGSFEIESFTPIINPPQTGILGVNAITQKVREVNGEIQVYPAMGLSLTYDHRVVDGAPAARFLKALKHNLENFTLMLAL